MIPILKKKKKYIYIYIEQSWLSNKKDLKKSMLVFMEN